MEDGIVKLIVLVIELFISSTCLHRYIRESFAEEYGWMDLALAILAISVIFGMVCALF